MMLTVEPHEKAALARLHGGPVHDLLLRLQVETDRELRAQKDETGYRRAQGRALLLEDLLLVLQKERTL